MADSGSQMHKLPLCVPGYNVTRFIALGVEAGLSYLGVGAGGRHGCPTGGRGNQSRWQSPGANPTLTVAAHIHKQAK